MPIAYSSRYKSDFLTDDVLGCFWSRVIITDSCWGWKGNSTHGYGYFHLVKNGQRHTLKAHRLSMLIDSGEDIPKGALVLHKCNNKICANPKHLYLGNHSDNAKDASKLGLICTVGQSRKTHCAKGHEFTESNTYRTKHGHRKCRRCRANGSLAKYHASKGSNA